MYVSLDRQIHLVLDAALERYKTELVEQGVDVTGLNPTGRWFIHCGIFGSSEDNLTYVFEVTHNGETSWIDEASLYVGDSIADYFSGVE